MAACDPDVEHLLELLAPLGAASARRMFGGWGAYVDGAIVGLVTGGTVYLKTDAQTRAGFEAAGSVPFAFKRGKREVETSYWSAPEAAMDSPAAMRPWARLALEAARRKAAAKPARRRSAQAPVS